MPYKRFLLLLLLSLTFFQKNAFPCQIFPPDTIKPDTIHYQNTDTIVIQKSILVYDTVRVHDTIFLYDSSMINQTYSNAILFSVGGSFPRQTISGNMTTTKKESILSNEKPSFSPYVDISYQHKKNNWSGEIGLGFIQINQHATYDFINSNITSYYQIDSTDNSYWNVTVVDTFYQVAGTDTTMQIVADSTWVPSYDTTGTTVHDTVNKTQKYSGTNRYLYFRIPLILRYRILQTEKFTVQAGTGLISCFLTKVKGQTLNISGELQPIEEFSPLRTSFFLHVDALVKYRFSAKINLFASLDEEMMLKSMFPKEYAVRKFHFFGVKTGLLINF